MDLISSAPGPLITRAAHPRMKHRSFAFPPSVARLAEWGRKRSTFGRARLAVRLSAAAVPTIRYASPLRRHLGELAPDIVHTNGLKMHLLGVMSCPAAASLVWHMHD